MTTHCQSPLCPNGNCTGCQNGQVWCQDPTCAPYCSQCTIPSNFDTNVNMVMIIIIISLLTILFIVWFMYGPGFFEPHDDDARAEMLTPSTQATPQPKTTPATTIEISTS